jgi:uncharacterized protein YndB with AHSA1/START domain
MVPDRIEQDTLIDAPVDVVWAIVTEAEHLGSWFADSARIDLRPGGELVLEWREHGSFRARVEQVEPPHRFSFLGARRPDSEPAEGSSTLVEFTMTAEGARTRLRVVESGFRGLDLSDEEKLRQLEGNTAGWEHELGELREYAAREVASARR